MWSRGFRRTVVLVSVSGLAVGGLQLRSELSTALRRPAPPDIASPPPDRQARFAELPIGFAAPRGIPEGVDYMARGFGYGIGVGAGGPVLVLGDSAPASAGGRDALLGGGRRPSRPGAVVRMQLVGSDLAARAEVDALLPGKVNYLIGNDPNRWQRGIPTFGKVTYRGVYPGVDVDYRGNQKKFEYDFVVAPGADPSVVALGFAGVDGVRIDDNGRLVLTVAGGELHQDAPVIYQDGAEGREAVPGSFLLRDDGGVGFFVGAYDHTLPLLIDPTLAYSTFLGGAGFDAGDAIAVDYYGNAYIAGATASSDFPTTPGAYDPTFNGVQDGFVAKLSADGSSLVYSTFLGGSGLDDTDSLAVDLRGSAYVRGITTSPDFPTTRGSFDPSFNGGIDAYVSKLSADGSSLSYSTYLGGSGFDSGSGIAVDFTGSAYVAGITGSPEFPTTPGAFQPTFHGVGGALPPTAGAGDYDAYLTKLSPDGSRLAYSTFIGGSRLDVGFKVAVDLVGHAYVAGMTMSPDFPTTPRAYDQTFNGARDGFVMKFNLDGSAPLYSTYLGGSGPEGVLGLAVDLFGSAYVTGGTGSPDFPTTPAAFDPTFNGGGDVYVTKLTPNGSGLAYSTFLGGAGADGGNGIAVDFLGQAYVTGGTSSADFPTTAGAPRTALAGDSDAFVTKLARNGSRLAYSTYLGGSAFDTGNGIAVDLLGAAYVTGETQSADFPTTAGAFDPGFNGDSDAFVTKLSSSGSLPR